mmetsp:Transcript_7350/g.13265  ORF Transcript_7350/g.13265 Transcript_7350/m.13265 type:complete len:678 (-) Transcript_7350:223-2256(-)
MLIKMIRMGCVVSTRGRMTSVTLGYVPVHPIESNWRSLSLGFLRNICSENLSVPPRRRRTGVYVSVAYNNQSGNGSQQSRPYFSGKDGEWKIPSIDGVAPVVSSNNTVNTPIYAPRDDDGYDEILAAEESAWEAGLIAGEADARLIRKQMQFEQELFDEADDSSEYGSYEPHDVHIKRMKNPSRFQSDRSLFDSDGGESDEILEDRGASAEFSESERDFDEIGSESSESQIEEVIQAAARERDVLKMQMRRQIEYYFSDDNLKRDVYLQKRIDKKTNGIWVNDLTNFARVIMISRGGNRAELIIEAVESSDLVEVVTREGSARSFVRPKKKYSASQAAAAARAYGIHGAEQNESFLVNRRRSESPSQSFREDDNDTLWPCKYFAAGYCNRGKRCTLTHDMRLVNIIERQWVQPTEKNAQRLALGVKELGLPARLASPSSYIQPSWGENPAKARKLKKQPFKYLLVLDLEGREEIIEFPAILLDAQTLTEVGGNGRFHRWVMPTRLFEGKMKEAPGIRANLQRRSKEFPYVIRDLHSWLQTHLEQNGEHGDDALDQVLCVTCGDWDLKTAVYKQCSLSGIYHEKLPLYLRRWANIKILFNELYKSRREVTGMKGMLRVLFSADSMASRSGGNGFSSSPQSNMRGMHHLGMHDTENIARVLVRMIEDGAMIRVTSQFRN